MYQMFVLLFVFCLGRSDHYQINRGACARKEACSGPLSFDCHAWSWRL